MSPKPLKSEARDFENVPEGWTNAVLCDVHDLGLVFSNYYGHEQHKIELGFWTGMHRSDDPRWPLMVYQRYTLSAHENALLRKHLEQWRGKRFRDEDECAAVELEDLIGKNLSIMVAHNQSGEKVYANVDAMGPGNGPPLGVPDGFVRKRDREDRNGRGRGTHPEPHPDPAPHGFPVNDHAAEEDDDLPF